MATLEPSCGQELLMNLSVPYLISQNILLGCASCIAFLLFSTQDSMKMSW